jgi:hypothetical protein
VPCTLRQASELCFYFVLQGQLQLQLQVQVQVQVGNDRISLLRDDCITLPEEAGYALRPSPDLELLEVLLPAAPRQWLTPLPA